MENIDQVHVLLDAVESGDLVTFLQCIQNGAACDTNTFLCCAAKKGKLEVVRQLIKLGVDLNVADSDGDTPLGLAAYNGHSEVVCELIKDGANINQSNHEGQTPLIWAAFKGHLEVARELLKNGADLNAPNKYGNSPLYWAACNGDLAIVCELIQHGANINAINEYGETPLWRAVRQLLTPNVLIDVADKHGDTRLYNEVNLNYLEIVRVLLEHGADANTANKEGVTPLFNAAQTLLKRRAK